MQAAGYSRAGAKCGGGAIRSFNDHRYIQNKVTKSIQHAPIKYQQRQVKKEVQVDSVLFAAGTIYSTSLFSLMIFTPGWFTIRRIMRNLMCLFPLIALYCYLLIKSWQPDTLQLMMPGSLQEGISKGAINPQFFPTASTISTLLSRQLTAASLWIHLLVGNFVIGRYIYLNGLEKSLVTLHSLLLAFVCGPVGLISHMLTTIFQRKQKVVQISGSSQSFQGNLEAHIVQYKGGLIILEPYQ
eukprot:TRINITY_DN2921_c0_g1_i3.p1 TRINITY_DN2921_c0_g1~~TRINITY_DN2921_c0_g1_i3.p1  ORF type:complete len:241 (+),score=5.39 TRINITY_DN2921_c0_g1_i3:26-748(+)